MHTLAWEMLVDVISLQDNSWIMNDGHCIVCIVLYCTSYISSGIYLCLYSCRGMPIWAGVIFGDLGLSFFFSSPFSPFSLSPLSPLSPLSLPPSPSCWRAGLSSLPSKRHLPFFFQHRNDDEMMKNICFLKEVCQSSRCDCEEALTIAKTLSIKCLATSRKTTAKGELFW